MPQFSRSSYHKSAANNNSFSLPAVARVGRYTQLHRRSIPSCSPIGQQDVAGYVMAVVKVIEIIAQSPQGWEQAAQSGLAEVAKSVHGIRSIYVKDLQAEVENNKIVQYRLNLKVSFVVDDRARE
jgi:dodecin